MQQEIFTLGTTSEVLERLKIALGSASDRELAQQLGVAPSTLSNWRARNSTPYPLCELVAAERRLSLDWLLLGVGEIEHMGAAHAAEPQAPYGDPRLAEIEAALRAWWAAASDAERVWFRHQLGREFPELGL